MRSLMIPSFVAATLLSGQTAPPQVSPDEAVSLTTPTLTLSGSLRLPITTGKVPVAIIIAGSGPTNRDGNSRMLPGNNNAYKLLAELLAAQGIASVRYDKRGIGDSVAPGMKEADLRFEMYVDDAAGWIAKLRSDTRFSTITVIGHSEGSLIGMLAASRAKADGYVSVAGVARPAGQILRDQLRPQIGSMAELWQQNETILASLEAGKTVDPLPSPACDGARTGRALSAERAAVSDFVAEVHAFGGDRQALDADPDPPGHDGHSSRSRRGPGTQGRGAQGAARRGRGYEPRDEACGGRCTAGHVVLGPGVAVGAGRAERHRRTHSGTEVARLTAWRSDRAAVPARPPQPGRAGDRRRRSAWLHWGRARSGLGESGR